MIDLAAEVEDKTRGANIVWGRWAAADPHLLVEMRQGIVRLLDTKLQSCGFPSLRELIP